MRIKVILLIIVTLTMAVQSIGEAKRRKYASIRKINFASFTYPHWSSTEQGGPYTLHKSNDVPDMRKMPFIEIWLQLGYIKYADITKDGNEEAIIVLDLITGGSAVPNIIYIYTLHKGQPKLLWAFATGDRADGGLKNIYCKNGFLVLETFSPVNKQGDCCPLFYQKRLYSWKNGSFHQSNNEQFLPLKKH